MGALDLSRIDRAASLGDQLQAIIVELPEDQLTLGELLQVFGDEGLLLLTILEDQVVPGLFCKGTFHGLRVGTAPVGFRSQLGEAHHDAVRLCIFRRCNILRSALSVAASGKQDSQPQQQTRHPSSSCSAFLHICNVILFCHTSRPEIALSFSHFPAGSFSV